MPDETRNAAPAVGDVLRNWGALALAAGALFWSAAAQWGAGDATISSGLNSLNNRLDLQAKQLIDLQSEINAGNGAMLQMRSRLDTFAEERARILANNQADHQQLHQRINEASELIQNLRERLAGLRSGGQP